MQPYSTQKLHYRRITLFSIYTYISFASAHIRIVKIYIKENNQDD